MALLLFGVFAVCLLAVLLTGANSYQSLTQRDRTASDSRTCAQYLSTRVRQADQYQAIGVEPFGGGDALSFRQDIDGREYLTRVYVWDGWLMELFSAADTALSPQDGERIMAAQALTAEQRDGLLYLSITPAQGERTELLLSPRCGEGDLP